MSIELEELRKLPIADKLRIVEQLWEDIADSQRAVSVAALASGRGPTSR